MAKVYLKGKVSDVQYNAYGIQVFVLPAGESAGYAHIVQCMDVDVAGVLLEESKLPFNDRPVRSIPVWVSALYSKSKDKAFPLFKMDSSFYQEVLVNEKT